MSDYELPQPTTNNEMYLFAIVCELRRMNQLLTEMQPKQIESIADVIELKEPVKRRGKQSKQ